MFRYVSILLRQDVCHPVECRLPAIAIVIQAFFSQFEATDCLMNVEHAQLYFSYVLAPSHEFDPLISDKINADLKQITMDMIADRIKTRL